MGVTDPETRQKMLNDFSKLPSQDAAFEEILEKTDIDEYSSKVMGNISQHIENLKLSLQHARIRMDFDPPEDPFLEDTKVKASDLCLRTISKMMDQCDAMQVMLQEAHPTLWEEQNHSTSFVDTGKKVMKTVCWVGALLLVTFVGQKYLRSKLK